MQKFFKSAVVLLTLLAFLVTAAGNVFGYAWCFSEGHSRIEQLTPAGCTDKGVDCGDTAGLGSAELNVQDPCNGGPCSDVLLSQGNAVVNKRSAKLFKVDLNTQIIAAPAFSNIRHHLKSLFFAAPPRVSQTLLAHRTVVLLN